ncbi:glycosyltransferase family 2 protein [Mucilaginibacter limnophilus]|uniref:Glycosyltransferase family 2 protein n=1 Tax=Mucilaginibacter limnophilus TaxID=1932778 RepID=A0A3S2UN40_9SPHI|nr:glycosyltransferase family 2 protein [Mucilaginibacter limnophilus]RVU02470.1 glycosyltransferase family 2 protein [Mucilaginibacter limnophilus]
MVSVIIPCYNCEHTLARAIESIIRQTYKPIEIILVNNNSNDATPDSLAMYQAKYPDTVAVYHERKRGAPAARNCGLQHASGEWVQFLDADDELLPAKIEQQVQIARFAEADVVAGECLLKYTSADQTITIPRPTDPDIWKGLITSNLGITSANLWRRTSLLGVGGWDEELSSSQEYDLLLRLLQNNAKIITDKHINTIVHFSDNSVSKSTDTERKKEVLNNRINLRLRIKNALIEKQMLTTRLARIIDTYIYTEIMHYYKFFPRYAGSLLRQYKLNVSIIRKLRLKAKQFLKDIKLSLS